MTSENHSARRINALAKRLDAKTYLEIGVARGVTFLGVRIQDKTGVDPKFLLQPERHRKPCIQLIEATSDEFFETCPRSVKFDIVFIDGLHTAEQTIRDFLGSVVHSHDRTVWVIDDTLPCDAHSALPTQAEAVDARARAGGHGQMWHGDVFKVPLLIRHLLPEFCYVTASTGGNPQTMVWRGQRDSQDRGLSREQIMGMTYPDFLRVQEQLNLVTEEAAIEIVCEALCASA